MANAVVAVEGAAVMEEEEFEAIEEVVVICLMIGDKGVDVGVDGVLGAAIAVDVDSRSLRFLLATTRSTTSSAGSVRRKWTTSLNSISAKDLELIANSWSPMQIRPSLFVGKVD